MASCSLSWSAEATRAASWSGCRVRRPGERGSQAGASVAFAGRLRARVEVPVELEDERFTTTIAQRRAARRRAAWTHGRRRCCSRACLDRRAGRCSSAASSASSPARPARRCRLRPAGGRARVFGGGGSPGAEVTVTIPRAPSTAAIGAILEKAEVVDSASRFELEAFSETGLQAGTYVLHKNDGYDRAIEALKAGPPIRPTKQLADPRGPRRARRRRADAEDRARSGADYEAAVKAAEAAGRVPGEGREGGARSRASCSRPRTRSRSRRRARSWSTSSWRRSTRTSSQVDMAKAKKKNLTNYDVLKIASLIEREAAFAGRPPQDLGRHLQPAQGQDDARHRRHHPVRGRHVEAAHGRRPRRSTRPTTRAR